MSHSHAKDPEPTDTAYDVIIVGGGASGLAAGVFVSRYGLETLILDRGQSAIRRSYCIENYLGFVGIDPETFLAIGREHARFEGCEIVDDLAVEVEATEGGFRTRTQDGAAVESTYVIAASAYNADYLCDLGDGSFHRAGAHPLECDEATGRTDFDGLYVAGWLSGSPHQVLISAGHGARVATELLRDHRIVEEEYWTGVADYWDWRVEEGTYGDERWHEHVDEWIEGTLPADRDLEDERVERIRRAVKRDRLEYERDDADRRRRIERGREVIERHL